MNNTWRELYGIKLELRKIKDELSLQELNCVLKKNGLFLPLTLYIFSKSWSIFKIKGQFLNPQNMQIPKLSQIFKIDQDLLEISLVKGSNYNIAQFFVDTVYINIRIGRWERGDWTLGWVKIRTPIQDNYFLVDFVCGIRNYIESSHIKCYFAAETKKEI